MRLVINDIQDKRKVVHTVEPDCGTAYPQYYDKGIPMYSILQI